MRLPVVTLVTCALWLNCASPPPPRSVLERDIADYRFRRYQQVLDVELPLPENTAVGHAATYVTGDRPVRVHPVLVTHYEQAAGLGNAIRNALRGMEAYTFDVIEIAGHHVWRVRGSSGDRWWLWVHAHYLVKVGAAEGQDVLPEPLVEAYLKVYPSDLDAHGYVMGDAPKGG